MRRVDKTLKKKKKIIICRWSIKYTVLYIILQYYCQRGPAAELAVNAVYNAAIYQSRVPCCCDGARTAAGQLVFRGCSLHWFPIRIYLTGPDKAAGPVAASSGLWLRESGENRDRETDWRRRGPDGRLHHQWRSEAFTADGHGAKRAPPFIVQYCTEILSTEVLNNNYYNIYICSGFLNIT